MYFEAKGQLDQAGEVYSRFQSEFPDHELLEKRKVMRFLMLLSRYVSTISGLWSCLLRCDVEIFPQLCLITCFDWIRRIISFVSVPASASSDCEISCQDKLGKDIRN